MITITSCRISSVYGPVASWRYGRSLGINVLGPISTCSFNCVYCELGLIQNLTAQRQVFVTTEQIIRDLKAVTAWDEIDVVTLSGSGEPTLARNLDEILQVVAMISKKPTVVLTNSSSMGDVTVRLALQSADYVAAKVDAVTSDQLRRINRPIDLLSLNHTLMDIHHFRRHYDGHLAIQTMVLSEWKPEQIMAYSQLMLRLQPQEIQLNLPYRVRPHPSCSEALACPEAPIAGRALRCISRNTLRTIAVKIWQATRIPVRYP